MTRGSVQLSKWTEVMRRVKAIKRLVRTQKLQDSAIEIEDLGVAVQFSRSSRRSNRRFKNALVAEGPFRLTWSFRAP